MNSLHLNVIVLNLRNMPYAYIISNLAFKFNDANFFEGFHKTVSLQPEYCKIYISVYYFKLFYIFELQTRLVYKSCNILILQINYSAKGKKKT